MDRPLKRGEICVYAGDYYFFQSNATSCYLYRYRSQVGLSNLAIFSPSRRKVSRPTDMAEAENWAATHQTPPPSKRDPTEITLDDIAQLVYELHGA